MSEARAGESLRILRVDCERALRRRLLDMGLTPKTVVIVRKMAPMGDPMELTVRGYQLTLRKDDAQEILVESLGFHGHGHHHHGRRGEHDHKGRDAHAFFHKRHPSQKCQKEEE